MTGHVSRTAKKISKLTDRISKADSRVLRRKLGTHRFGGVELLEAQVLETGEGPQARLFFKSGTKTDNIQITGAAGELARQSIGGAPVIDCDWHTPAEGITIEVAGSNKQIVPQPVETHLFAGLNCIVAQRNGETIDDTVEWLRYHISRHDLQAVVILDRVKPEEDSEYFAALKDQASEIEGLQRLVYLTADIPLGKPNLCPEAHPYNAPGAPGKDRMDVPPPDPWRSPLGEWLIFEIIRNRFLRDARAVANIELCDLIAPISGKSLF